MVIAASVIGRTLAAWSRATPIYFPDEYIYSEVGRSIAEHGRPMVRGGSAHFPALLQPLLTAPAWFFDDVATSYRTIQLINVVVMSLGAVAVFWLARRLGIGEDTARRMMRSQLVANQLHGAATAEYVVGADCANRGPLDLSPGDDVFP